MDSSEKELTTETESLDIELIDFSEIKFRNRDLLEWEEYLTVSMPSLPALTIEIDRALVALHNKYQTAYNCYNELVILYGRFKSDFQNFMDKKCSTIISEIRSKSSAARIPAKETLEGMARSRFSDLRKTENALLNIEFTKAFFENNKNKLEKAMHVASRISFSANQSDKMFNKAGNGDGL